MSSSATAKRSGLSSAANDANSSNKKSKTADSHDSKVGEKKSPYDVYLEARTDFYNEHPEIQGEILIKGISSSGDSDEEDSDDEENTDTSKYTTEQVKSLRVIMFTKNRQDQFDNMRQLVLQDQANEDFLMFGTSYSYQVAASWEHLKHHILPRKSASMKLDILIAYTLVLQQYDCWMHDNEGDMDTLVKGLATAWRNLLKKSSDEDLGWDTHYTKPGVLELLEQFKSQIESMESYFGLGKFKYM